MSAPNQLSLEELKFIDSFCKKKDIVYVDLRIELVDHLAELVLEFQEKHPNTSFRDAFHGVYKSFGIFGFMDIATQHEKQMQKRYWREIWQYFKTWLSPPKVFLTFTISACLYFLFDAFGAIRLPGLAFTVTILCVSVIVSIFQYRRNKRILNGERNILMSGAYQGLFWYSYILFQLIVNIKGQGSLRYDFFTQPAVLTTVLVVTSIFTAANIFLQEKAAIQLRVMKKQMI